MPATPYLEPFMAGRVALGFKGLQRGRLLEIAYPLRQETSAEIVADKEYHVRRRGDTVVRIAPQGQRGATTGHLLPPGGR